MGKNVEHNSVTCGKTKRTNGIEGKIKGDRKKITKREKICLKKIK